MGPILHFVYSGDIKQISMQPQTTVSKQLAHLVEWTIFHTQMIQLQHCHRIFCHFVKVKCMYAIL